MTTPLTLNPLARCAAVWLLVAATLPARAQDDEMEDVAIDPLTDIALDMDAVVADLSVQETGPPTQETQSTIVKKLDALIEQLERELQAAAGSGSGANPQRPLQDSMIIGGPGGMGDLRAPRELGKNWGELPPKERERILQSLTEGFPPHYQRILEHYYRRLAAEQSASTAGEDPQGSEQDGASDIPADSGASASGGGGAPAADAAPAAPARTRGKAPAGKGRKKRTSPKRPAAGERP